MTSPAGRQSFLLLLLEAPIVLLFSFFLLCIYFFRVHHLPHLVMSLPGEAAGGGGPQGK